MDEILRIGKRSFFLSLAALLILMAFAVFLSIHLPSGTFERVIVEGKEMLVAGSYKVVTKPELRFYRYLSPPLEVLFSSDGPTVIVILLFLLILGGSFTILLQSFMISMMMDRLSLRFEKRRFLLLFALSFFFMFSGAAFGVFEELIILVPFCIVLARKMGWDSLVGLGVSLLSAGLGFSAALFNPFTLGVAQKLAGLPLYSATLFRLGVFLSIYLILQVFLLRYAKAIEKEAKSSLVYNEEPREDKFEEVLYPAKLSGALSLFGRLLLLMPLFILWSVFSPIVSSLLFVLLALLFLFSSFFSVIHSGVMDFKKAWSSFIMGVIGVAPAIVLILLAMSIKLILTRGLVMDTILLKSVEFLSPLEGYSGVYALFFLVMFLNFFISSGSAKAFLLLPILLPLTDYLQINRQIAVQAFLFGDGFSNLMYPTNAALMIGLGFSVVSYPKWLRWTFPLQAVLILVSLFWLTLAHKMGLGPF
ncbi:MAG: hypothetical protein GX046_00955 [Tissierellia bacterium]|nr:hypothetical protein [Tissierellia bacterium]